MNWYKQAQVHPSVSEIESLKKLIPDMEGYWSNSVTKKELIHTLNKIMGTYEGAEKQIPNKGSNTIINLPNKEVMLISPVSSWKGTYGDKMYYIMFFRSKNEMV